MRSTIKWFWIKTALLVTALVTTSVAFSNNGQSPTAALKGNVPVNYYKGFMLAVALLYAVYLIIRARRRKRMIKLNGKSSSSFTSNAGY